MSAPTGGRVTKLVPSHLSTWLTCPRQYRLKHVERARTYGGPWAHLDVGNVVHGALHGWHDAPREQRTPAALADAVTRGWKTRAFRDDAQSQEWMDRARGWVRDYAADPARINPDVTPLARERTVTCRAGNGRFVEGRLDRLDERPAGLVVVDYKTGKNESSDWDAESSWALAVYAMAVTVMWRRTRPTLIVEGDLAAELHHVPTGAVSRVTYTRDRLLLHLDRMHGVADDIEAAHRMVADNVLPGMPTDAVADITATAFPATPNPLCKSCPFWDRCPEGQATNPAYAKPWHYLPEKPAAAAA